MPGTADRTRDPPVRRMSVARGTLSAPEVDLDETLQERATAAALLAVKQTPSLLAYHDAFLATHIDVLFVAEDGVSCTVTVQAHARAPLDQAALLGVAAALSCLAGSDGDARIDDLRIVQSVTG